MIFRNAWGECERSFALLAPANEQLFRFPSTTGSHELHGHLLTEMQRLRGRIYLAEGAVGVGDLDSRGRHVQPADRKSWHLLTIGSFGEVIGCTRFQRWQGPFSWSQLGVRQAPIAQSDVWGHRFRASVDAELSLAANTGMSYIEVGGWALSREIRGTAMALKSVLAIYAWSQLQGGALGIATATERNESAAILRRLGGRPLLWNGAELPPYYDDRYGCYMEVLRFDSRVPNPKYAGLLNELRERMAAATVIHPGQACEEKYGSPLPRAFPVFEPEIAC